MAVDPHGVASPTESSPAAPPSNGSTTEVTSDGSTVADEFEETRVGSRPRRRPAHWDIEDAKVTKQVEMAEKDGAGSAGTAIDGDDVAGPESSGEEAGKSSWADGGTRARRSNGIADRLRVKLPAIARREDPRRGRRVKRVVRRIELWSVLKVSLLFYFCLYAATLGAGVLLWGFAHSAGLIENFEGLMQEVGFDDFRFFGEQLFTQAAIIGGALVLVASVMTVLGTALVNLISEVTGGIRFVVIEEDLDGRPSASRS